MKGKLVGLFLVLALVLGGTALYLRASGDGGSGQGKQVAFTLTPEQSLAGEQTTISGRLTPAGRPVTLQRAAGDTWVDVAEAPSGQAGKYSFPVPVTDTATTYRIEGAKARVADRDVPLRRSADIVVVAVKPSVTLVLGPSIAQNRDSTEVLSVGEAIVVPARKGSSVAIERNRNGSWSQLAAGEQDARGHFSFVLPAGAADELDSLRAVTTLTKGAAPIYSTVGAKPTYELVWRDEFDGDTLADHWNSVPALTRLRPCTSTSLETSVVRDGTLRISALLDKTRPKSAECPKGWLLNSQLSTQRSKTFTYGMFAARVKVQPETGMHGGFWLYNDPEPDPGGDKTDAKQLGMELDALEYFGDEDVSKGLKGSPQNSIYHYTPQSQGPPKLNKLGGRRDVRAVVGDHKMSENFHIFSVEWTPDAIIFRLDGQETFRNDGALSTRGLYVLLSMITSPFESDGLDVKTLPGTMEVDWVRVWQKPTT